MPPSSWISGAITTTSNGYCSEDLSNNTTHCANRVSSLRGTKTFYKYLRGTTLSDLRNLPSFNITSMDINSMGFIGKGKGMVKFPE